MRKLLLYPRLAFQNLGKNRQFYVPYLLSCVGLAAVFCILLTLLRDPQLGEMSGGSDVKFVLALGCVVIGIFSVFVLFYTSSVLTKSRKKEFGLYNVLGMEKRQIGHMLAFETLYTTVFALAGGFLCAAVFSKLLQLALVRLLGGDAGFAMQLDLPSFFTTAVLFTGLFFLIYLRTLLLIHKLNPADLLRGSSEGEREPRSNWVLAVLGVLLLGGGYVIAVTTSNAFYAILAFFLAVLLVIGGTYLLFTAVSVVALKGLRANKRFYYRTDRFATVSGMLYRMKRSAASLASICILSTMVLVTISTTVCLWAGVDSILAYRYPADIVIKQDLGALPTEEQFAVVQNTVRDTIRAEGRTVTGWRAYRSLEFSAIRDGDDFLLGTNMAGSDALFAVSNAVELWFTDTANYEAITGEAVTVAPGEALCWTDCTEPLSGELRLPDRSYRLDMLDSFPVDSGFSITGVHTVYLVVSDYAELESLEALQLGIYGEHASAIGFRLLIDIDGADEDKIACTAAINHDLQGLTEDTGIPTRRAESRAGEEPSTRAFYGGFLFIGLLLGAVFAVATGLIIYYKQLSEGYDDRARFEIMQKVGMTPQEVRATIRAQVLLVFFLPLLTAAIHIAFAFPMIRQILGAFGMLDIGLFIGCTLLTLAVFAALYVGVYLLTARTYYRIVSGQSAA